VFKRDVEVVRLLLKDLRVDATLADNSGLLCVGFRVVEWLIASGRDLGGPNDVGVALEAARRGQKYESVWMLERFMADPLPPPSFFPFFFLKDLCVRQWNAN